MTIKNKQSGFTLIEMIVVISIIAIIASLSSLIIGRSLESYAALDRRNQLQTSTRLVLERISRELRNSLPYSICVYDSASQTCNNSAQEKFYFIPVKDSGRFQNKGGNYVTSNLKHKELKKDTEQLDVISTNEKNRLNAIGNNVSPAFNTGDWVVIFNINNVDIYQPVNALTNKSSRHQIAKITQIEIQADGDASNDIDYIEFTDYVNYSAAPGTAKVKFANDKATTRLHIIENDVVTLFYYDEVYKKLYRETTTFSDPANETAGTPTGNERLLMENVTACTFTYVVGDAGSPATLRIDLTVEKQGEKIQVIHQAKVHNVP